MYDYITTYSKIHMDPANPRAESIKIEDIAHALSLICRANGHLKRFYSVAQHSVNCAAEAKARGLTGRVQLACLLHDASEAYLSDITRPVKRHLPAYIQMEHTMQEAVWKAFGLGDLSAAELDFVDEIDDAVLHHEFMELMGELIFEREPRLFSVPDFSLRDFAGVEEQFVSLARKLQKIEAQTR